MRNPAEGATTLRRSERNRDCERMALWRRPFKRSGGRRGKARSANLSGKRTERREPLRERGVVLRCDREIGHFFMQLHDRRKNHYEPSGH